MKTLKLEIEENPSFEPASPSVEPASPSPEPAFPAAEPDFLIKGIKKNVFMLGLVSMFTDISSEMIYPVIPIFLTTVLGAPMAVVGFIEGVAESTASLLKVFSGWYSDWVGKRKPFVVAGYTLSALSKPIFAFASAWPLVLAGRFLDRFGKGVRTSARDALIADSTEEALRGRSFGLHKAMDTAGAVIGSLIAVIVLGLTGNNYNLLFMGAFIPGILSVLLVLFFVSERRRVPNPITFKTARFERDFKTYVLISLGFALGNSSDVFLILRAQDLGFSISQALLCYIVYNIVYALGSYPAGIFSDRVGRKGAMVLGFLIFAAVYLGFAMMPENIYLWSLFMVYGLYAAFTKGNETAYVVDLVSPDKRGTALGVFHAGTGIMVLFASLIAGVLWDNVSASAPFLFGAFTALVSAFLLLALMPEIQTHTF